MLAVVAVVCACWPAPASALGAQGIAFASFEAKGSGGHRFEAFSVKGGNQPPGAGIRVKRGGLETIYATSGRDSPGIHADLGALGHADLDFKLRKRTVERPEKGCRIITETGTFAGSLSFTGEGGYASLKRSRANGIVLRFPNGFCALPADRPSTSSAALLLPITNLTAKSTAPHGTVEFSAVVAGPGDRSSILDEPMFKAELRERVGTLTTVRSATGFGPRESFVIGPGPQPSSATATPPAPFSGGGSFARANGTITWTGDLSVTFLGTGPTALAGESFAARLCPRIELFADCEVALPPG